MKRARHWVPLAALAVCLSAVGQEKAADPFADESDETIPTVDAFPQTSTGQYGIIPEQDNARAPGSNVARGRIVLLSEVDANALGPDTALPDEPGELFTMALEHNPKIRAAQAELDAASARLDQLRSEVLRTVATLHAQVKELSSAMRNVKSKNGSPEEMQAMDARIRAVQEDLRYSVGIPQRWQNQAIPLRFTETKRVHAVPELEGEIDRPKVDSATTELLSTPVSITFEDENLGNILQFVGESTECTFLCDPAISEKKIPYINLSDIKLKALLQALSDVTEDTVFVIRDYGIFATTRAQAYTLAAPSVPDIPLYDVAKPKSLTPAPVLGRSPKMSAEGRAEELRMKGGLGVAKPE